MRKSTNQKSSRQAPKPNHDATIIREAVAYAQAIGAYHNGFKADPGGDNDTAASLGDRHYRQALSILPRLASIPASSAQALDAKARLVQIVLDDTGNYGCISEESTAFFRSFAADVHSFLEPIIGEHMTAERELKHRKKAA